MAEIVSPLKQKTFYDPRVMDVDDGSKALWTSESVELAFRGLSEGYKLKENPFLKTVKGVFLRKANLPYRYTEDELFFIQKCMEDKIFYGNTFGKLKDGNKGWVNITLRDYQEDLLTRYSNNCRNIIMFPRQSGKTTTTVIEICHFLGFNYDKDCVVVAQSEKVVNEILGKIKEFFANLPFFLQPGFVSFTKKGCVLENGCRLSIGVASESVVQGFSLDLLYIDEFAYIANSRVKAFWENVYPTLINNPESRCIITSTPNGRNMFYTLWNNAINKDNNFVPYRIYWQDVPGRDEKFKETVIRDIGLSGWLMGFECSFDTQLKTIFHTKTQTMLREKQRMYEKEWSMDNHPIGHVYQMEFINQDKVKYDLKNDFFLIGIDIAEGLEQDSSVLKIKKIDWNIEEQRLEYISVGVFKSNTIAVDEFAEMAGELMQEFDTSKIKYIVENNTYGGEFFLAIDNLVHNDSTFSFIDDSVFARFFRNSKEDFERGIRWSKNKSIAVKSFSTLTAKEIMKEYHSQSLEEYMNFGRQQNGTYSASYGHDDLVMGDVGIAHFIKCNNIFSKAFLDYVEAELRLRYNDEILEVRLAKEAAIKKEKNRFIWRGWHLRDHQECYDRMFGDKDDVMYFDSYIDEN